MIEIIRGWIEQVEEWCWDGAYCILLVKGAEGGQHEVPYRHVDKSRRDI